MISADLGKQLESYIQQLVDTGRYGSKSEVLREGVRLVQDRETRLAALDASIMRGLADADADRTKEASDVSDPEAGNCFHLRYHTSPHALVRKRSCHRLDIVTHVVGIGRAAEDARDGGAVTDFYLHPAAPP